MLQLVWTLTQKNRPTKLRCFREQHPAGPQMIGTGQLGLFIVAPIELVNPRTETRLCLFYKIVYDLVALPLPHYIEPLVRPSRCNFMNFRQ